MPLLIFAKDSIGDGKKHVLSTPMHKSDTATIIGSLRILVNDIQSDDGIANMAIAEAADRMEEMQTREKNLSQKLCCFTGESLEDAADRLREEHNKAKMETESWKAQVKVRMGLMKELKDAMGIDGSEDELKAALKYVKGLKAQIDRLPMTDPLRYKSFRAIIDVSSDSIRITYDGPIGKNRRIEVFNDLIDDRPDYVLAALFHYPRNYGIRE